MLVYCAVCLRISQKIKYCLREKKIDLLNFKNISTEKKVEKARSDKHTFSFLLLSATSMLIFRQKIEKKQIAS